MVSKGCRLIDLGIFSVMIRRLTDFRHIIWDWNGTLLNDLALIHAVTNQQLAENGLPGVSLSQYRSQFSHPIKSFLEQLGFDFGTLSFSDLASRFEALYTARMHTATLHHDVEGTLKVVTEAGCSSSILSASHHAGLLESVEYFGVSSHFKRVYGLEEKTGHSKVALGQELFRLLEAAPEDVVIVGDTDHDLEVAHELGIECRLVARGLQQIDRLRAHAHPHRVVVAESLKELL